MTISTYTYPGLGLAEAGDRHTVSTFSIAESLTRYVCDSVHSEHSRVAYARAIRDFLAWVGQKPEMPLFSRALVQEYRANLEGHGKRPPTINQALSAIRKLASEAAAAGGLDPGVAASISSLRGVPVRGSRAGNWLGQEDMLSLLVAPDQTTLRGRRDFVLLGLLMGAGLRRAEACGLAIEQIQHRDGRMMVVDLIGKGQRLRTVPLPQVLWSGVNDWIGHLGSNHGLPLLRRVDGHGSLTEKPLTASGAWWVVRAYAEKLGFPAVRPHDLRRTFAKAALRGGAEMDQIRAALGHSNVAVTQRYCGQEMYLDNPACEKLGL
ncbi:MAG TPA: tyrosine-type recombinase/integrase [Bryobacteraceae bacterium]|nr:tyrosine-type recombinase/integrase [Bryobacteraceae bacterium]